MKDDNAAVIINEYKFLCKSIPINARMSELRQVLKSNGHSDVSAEMWMKEFCSFHLVDAYAVVGRLVYNQLEELIRDIELSYIGESEDQYVTLKSFWV